MFCFPRQYNAINKPVTPSPSQVNQANLICEKELEFYKIKNNNDNSFISVEETKWQQCQIDLLFKLHTSSLSKKYTQKDCMQNAKNALPTCRVGPLTAKKLP